MAISMGAVSTKPSFVLVRVESETEEGSVVQLFSPSKRTVVLVTMRTNGEVFVRSWRDGGRGRVVTVVEEEPTEEEFLCVCEGCLPPSGKLKSSGPRD